MNLWNKLSKLKKTIIILSIILLIILTVFVYIVLTTVEDAIETKAPTTENEEILSQNEIIEGNIIQDIEEVANEIQEENKINDEKENTNIKQESTNKTEQKKEPTNNGTSGTKENTTTIEEPKKDNTQANNNQENSNKEENKQEETEQENTEVKEETTNPSLANTHFTKYNAEKTAHAVSYLNSKIQKEADYDEYGGKAIAVTTKPCKNWFSYSYDEKLNSLVITGSTLKVYIEDEYRYDSRGINYYLYDTKAYIYTE